MNPLTPPTPGSPFSPKPRPRLPLSTRPDPTRRPRAFALPLVILLGLAAALGVMTLMSKAGEGTLITRRAVEEYRSHHRQAGVREIVSGAMRSSGVSSSNLRSLLAPDGTLCTLSVAGSPAMRIIVNDAQGSALSNLSRLSDEDFETASRILHYLETTAGASAASYTRSFGPVKVSARTADAAVLSAVALAVTDGSGASFGDAVVRRRNESTLTPNDIRDLARDAGVADDLLDRVAAYVTLEPVLFHVTAESVADPTGAGAGGMRERAGRPLVERTGGLIRVDGRSQGFRGASPFLTWEDQVVGSVAGDNALGISDPRR